MSDYDWDVPEGKGTNRHARPSVCPRCDGDRFVVIALRHAEMLKDGELWRSKEPNCEVYGPCPVCNHDVIKIPHHG